MQKRGNENGKVAALENVSIRLKKSLTIYPAKGYCIKIFSDYTYF